MKAWMIYIKFWCLVSISNDSTRVKFEYMHVDWRSCSYSRPLESLLNARPSATMLKYSWKVTRHFGEHTIRVDVPPLYFGDNSIEAATHYKQAAKKPIRKLVEWQHIPLPSVWSQLIGLDENKTVFAKFLPLVIVTYGKSLPDKYELVSGAEIADATHVSSSKREEVGLHGDHEEADTRLYLHSWCNKWRKQKVASFQSRYWCNAATDTLDCIKTSWRLDDIGHGEESEMLPRTFGSWKTFDNS